MGKLLVSVLLSVLSSKKNSSNLPTLAVFRATDVGQVYTSSYIMDQFRGCSSKACTFGSWLGLKHGKLAIQ